jgi:hypothetical protein
MTVNVKMCVYDKISIPRTYFSFSGYEPEGRRTHVSPCSVSKATQTVLHNFASRDSSSAPLAAHYHHYLNNTVTLYWARRTNYSNELCLVSLHKLPDSQVQ